MSTVKYDRHKWMCMALFAALLVAICIFAGGCSERNTAVPRQIAYPRIERSYDTVYSCVFAPYNIELNSNADVSRRGNGIDGGFTVRYDRYGASIFCSYNKVHSAGELQEMLRRRVERALLDAGSESPDVYKFDFPSRNCSGIVLYSERNCLTPVHFIATDSVAGVVSGTVVLDSVGNTDSIAPVLEYLAYDIRHLVNNLNFKLSQK